MCESVVLKDPENLQFVPNHSNTQEICKKDLDSCPYVLKNTSSISVRPKRCIKKLLIDIHMDGNIFLIDASPKYV